MVNTADAANEVSGRSICAKLLMKIVGRQDISGQEAPFELSGLELWRCSQEFSCVSLRGSRHLEVNGDTATTSSSLDKYCDRPRDQQCSWYEFTSKNGKVPVISGGATHATWPLNEDYCRTMLLLHWPSWFNIEEVQGEEESWIQHFKSFVVSDHYPTFVKAQVLKAEHIANHQPEEQHEEEQD